MIKRRKIRKLFFLFLLFIFFFFICQKKILSENTKNNLVEVNIIGKNLFKTYYVIFSSVDKADSFKIYDI